MPESSKSWVTEKPYVVATEGGAKRSDHYTYSAAKQAAKDANGVRVIYGRHRGHWVQGLTYKRGVLMPRIERS